MSRRSLYLMVVPISVLGVWLVSGCGYRSPEERAERITEKIALKLELNGDQEAQLIAFKDTLMEKRRQLRRSRRTIEEELIAQLGREKMDQEHLNKIITDEKAELDDLVSIFVKGIADFHGSLTPEQRAKLVEMVEKWQDHRGRYHD